MIILLLAKRLHGNERMKEMRQRELELTDFEHGFMQDNILASHTFYGGYYDLWIMHINNFNEVVT